MNTTFEHKETFKKVFLHELKTTFNKDLNDSTVYERYTVLAKLLNQDLEQASQNTVNYIEKHHLKKTIYFSMEFLMGRLVTNNLQNSGHYDVVKEAFKDLG
ncbi:MAG: glycogen phosphorylase, partial [Tenericutes bacterium HGW-Tenericutes-6]